ncbi:MAG: hypothetical protein AAF502_18035 [Bacteroidota bacterium]
MQKIVSTIFLLLLCHLAINAQNNSNCNIPADAFEILKQINQLEVEVNSLKLDQKELEQASVLLHSSREKFKNSSFDIFNNGNVSTLLRDELYNRIYDLSIELTEYGSNFQNFKIKLNVDQPEQLLVEILDYLNRDTINLDQEELTKKKNSIEEKYTSGLNDLEKYNEEILSGIISTGECIKKLKKSNNRQSNLHRTAIMVGLPAFCITILLLFLVPYWIEYKKANSGGSTDNDKQYLLDVATVLLLTLTILILGLAEMITSEVLGTLLGGISAYVLNRSSVSQRTNNANRNTN